MRVWRGSLINYFSDGATPQAARQQANREELDFEPVLLPFVFLEGRFAGIAENDRGVPGFHAAPGLIAVAVVVAVAVLRAILQAAMLAQRQRRPGAGDPPALAVAVVLGGHLASRYFSGRRLDTALPLDEGALTALAVG